MNSSGLKCALAATTLMTFLVLGGCAAPAEQRAEQRAGKAIEKPVESGAPGAGVPAAMSTEVIQAFRSSEGISRHDDHALLLAGLQGLLEKNDYRPRDFKVLAKKYRLDPGKFVGLSNEVFLTRDRDGEPAVIIHLSHMNAKKSKSSVFSASVIWFAYGGIEGERRTKAEKARNDLQLWWTINDPFRE